MDVSSAANAATATVNAVAAAAPHMIEHDPLLDFVKWASVILLVLLVGAKPLMSYVRQQNDISNQNRKDDAEGVLYTHLAEQVREYRALADTAFNERNSLLIRVTELELRVEQFVATKEQLVIMQERIEKKDEVIASLVQQGMEERTKFLAILVAKDAQYADLEKAHRALEARVTRDEVLMGVATVCPRVAEAAAMVNPDATPAS